MPQRSRACEMNVKQKNKRREKKTKLSFAIFSLSFSFYFCAFRSRLRDSHCRWYTKGTPIYSCVHVSCTYWRFCYRRVLATSAMCYGAIHIQCIAYSGDSYYTVHSTHTPSVLCEKLSDFFSLLAVSFRLVLFDALVSLSRSSNENGVISCIGPPSHITTHLSATATEPSSQPASQPGNTQRQTFMTLFYRYTRSAHTAHTNTFFSSNAWDDDGVGRTV